MPSDKIASKGTIKKRYADIRAVAIRRRYKTKQGRLDCTTR